MWKTFHLFAPLLIFFLSLAAAIFACKAHGQAKENGEVLRDLRRQLEDSGQSQDVASGGVGNGHDK